MGWSETTRERYHVAADTPEEAHAILNAISHYGALHIKLRLHKNAAPKGRPAQ